MNYHRNPSLNHKYKTLIKSKFYFQSLKSEPQTVNEEKEKIENLIKILKQEEILFSENNESNPIEKKKARSQKLSCECTIY
ncbi:unnamed protein product [Paramecium octaurelia]|uniref:Uncharacterized protein n=1 Tax=Paramecium octaurelia TaxID=43137 RepID=A0A8S1XYQ4_PAROT|nr:unnamed protein product [Paramecium octaurelia]